MQSSLDEAVHLFSTFLCGNCGHSISVPIRCSDRFCETCGRSRKARIVQRFEELYHFIPEKKSYSFKFLTLTVPSGPDLKTQYDQVLHSFRRLRQRIFWKKRVDGGGFVIELTVNSDGLWNVHLHAIIYSAFLPVKQLSLEWSQCSPGKIVDIRMITSRQVIMYISKYVSKSLVLNQKREEASEVLRGRRMFQPFGIFQNAVQKTEQKLHFCSECGEAQWQWLDPSRSVSECLGVEGMTENYYDLINARPPPKVIAVNNQISFIR